MSTSASSLRDQLIGSWELIYYYGHLPGEPDNRFYPLGEDAKGSLMYAPDGYMSTQILRPGQDLSHWDKGPASATEPDWAEMGKRYHAYTGPFFLDETVTPPLLNHEIQISNIPIAIGSIQQRNVRIEVGDDEVTYLHLSVDRMQMGGAERVVVLKWRRREENRELRPPVGK